MRITNWFLGAISIGFSFSPLVPAHATPVTPPACTSANVGTTTCILDGETFNPSVSGAITTAADAHGLTFLAQFTTGSQNASGVSVPVLDYLSLMGVTATYLGRAGSGNSSTWSSGVQGITATNGNGSDGTWSVTLQSAFAGTLIGSYVAIHAGNGQLDNLFMIDSPGTSGTYQTNNGHNLSNFDLFGCQLGGTGACNGVQLLQAAQLDPTRAPAPEPASMALLGTGLTGIAGVLRRRKRAADSRR